MGRFTFTFSGIGMNAGENDDGNNYNWYGSEVDYRYYRFIVNAYFTLTADVQYMKDDRASKMRSILIPGKVPAASS